MKYIRKIIAINLVGIMIFSCFPSLNMDDLSRDGIIDLHDVILVIKGVAKTVETSESIKKSVGQVVSVITVAAGLKTVIKSSKDNGFSKTTYFYDYLFLISSNTYTYFFNTHKRLDELTFNYKSIVFSPTPPPPRTFCHFTETNTT